MIRENFGKIEDKYLLLTDEPLNIISIFDELRYDRSDIDMLSPGMRQHITNKLKTIGFKQKSAKLLISEDKKFRCHLPMNHALGSSPFHATDYLGKKDGDYFVLEFRPRGPKRRQMKEEK